MSKSLLNTKTDMDTRINVSTSVPRASTSAAGETSQASATRPSAFTDAARLQPRGGQQASPASEAARAPRAALPDAATATTSAKPDARARLAKEKALETTISDAWKNMDRGAGLQQNVAHMNQKQDIATLMDLKAERWRTENGALLPSHSPGTAVAGSIEDLARRLGELKNADTAGNAAGYAEVAKAASALIGSWKAVPVPRVPELPKWIANDTRTYHMAHMQHQVATEKESRKSDSRPWGHELSQGLHHKAQTINKMINTLVEAHQSWPGQAPQVGASNATPVDQPLSNERFELAIDALKLIKKGEEFKSLVREQTRGRSDAGDALPTRQATADLIKSMTQDSVIWKAKPQELGRLFDAALQSKPKGAAGSETAAQVASWAARSLRSPGAIASDQAKSQATGVLTVLLDKLARHKGAVSDDDRQMINFSVSKTIREEDIRPAEHPELSQQLRKHDDLKTLAPKQSMTDSLLGMLRLR